MTAIVLRHADYNDIRLTEQWVKDSIEKWRKIRDLIWNVADTQISMLTSTAPRAEETGYNILKWLWAPNSFMDVNPSLWKDIQHRWDLQASLRAIWELPPHAVLMVISHLDFVYDIAKELWYDWKQLIWLECDTRVGEYYLEGYTIENSIYRKKLLQITEEYWSE